MPTRVILYTIHNYLTKRDYSYSIEDICDLSIGICIGIWIYSFYNESSKKVPYFEYERAEETYMYYALRNEFTG